MPSLLPGYAYDIFISYRQNDNRSGWVTEFVKALEEELSATIKEPVSVYFDSNPHDGLLETHNVDKSLEGKLKCLIFIPIVSQTYCDTKSFAWQQEFCMFNKLAKGDTFGRDIKLHNGNVASRILPVKIHGLDADDQKALEGEMGSVLRAVDFIYKELGVNRPLTPEDDPAGNLNKTRYRNQVNKVANAVKEILLGLKNFGKPALETMESTLGGKASSSGKSIVVLPFEDLSHEKDQDYFCDGLSEEIIASLARIKGLRVVSRTSSMHYKGAKKPLAQITQELGVKYVLEGSVRKQAKSLKITVQLIEAELDSHLWSDKYNGTLEDIFDIQETMAAEIVKALRVQLTDEEDTGLRKRHTNSAEAHELYLRGNHYLWMVTPESVNKAIGYFEKALEIDPQLALAYAGLAMAYNGAAWFEYFDPKEAFSKARQYATRAVEIDDTLAEAYSCLGYNNCLDWNLSLAEQQLKRACELKPNFADAHMYYAWYLGGQGRIQEALHEMKLALLLDPVSLIINANMTFPHYWMKQHDQAIAQALNTLKLEPTFYLAHWFLGVAYAQAGAYEKAIGAFEKAVTFSGGGPYYQAWLGHAYAIAGKKDKARTILEELTLLSTPKKSFSYQVMILHLGLGDLKEAMRWLEVAYAERAPLLWYLKIDPYVEPLRQNPRFSEMLRGIGFLVAPSNSTLKTNPPRKSIEPSKAPADTRPSTSAPAGKKVAMVASLIGLLILSIMGYLFYGQGGKQLADLDGTPNSIAVLPFANMSQDPEQEYFSDGITEQIITNLAHIKSLKVIARTSVMKFKKTEKSIAEIARELNVTHVLQGSIRKSGDRIRVNAQLIAANDETHVWAQDYERPLSDIFTVQDEVSEAIARSLEHRLTPGEFEKLKSNRPANVEAYQHYLRGYYFHFDVYYYKHLEEDFIKAENEFKEAIRLDPAYGLAFAGLADLYNRYRNISVRSGDESLRLRTLRDSCSRISMRLSPNDPYVISVRAYSFFNKPGRTDADVDSAFKYRRRALEIAPNSASICEALSLDYREFGLYHQALRLRERTISLDPSYVHSYPLAAWLYVQLGELGKAEASLRKGLLLEPEDIQGLINLINLKLLTGDVKSAEDGLQRIKSINPDTDTRALEGYLLALKGDKEKALALNSEWYVYLAFGMKKEALDRLEGNAFMRYQYLSLKNLPLNDPLRGEPRFTKLLEDARVRYEANLKRYAN